MFQSMKIYTRKAVRLPVSNDQNSYRVRLLKNKVFLKVFMDQSFSKINVSASLSISLHMTDYKNSDCQQKFRSCWVCNCVKLHDRKA